jgi:hypothetical protein
MGIALIATHIGADQYDIKLQLFGTTRVPQKRE